MGDEQADLVEIKNLSSPVGERERGELVAHLALQGKDVMMPGAAGAKATPRTIRMVVWVILNPDFLTSNANVVFMTDRLKKNASLEFRVYDDNGKMVSVTGANYRTVLAGLAAAAKKSKAAREAEP